MKIISRPIIIAGSRCTQSLVLVPRAMNHVYVHAGWKARSVISGKASRGVDILGEIYAKSQFPYIPVDVFPAKWNDTTSPTYDPILFRDPQAGFARNKEMAIFAKHYDGALVAIWDGVSNGTANMIREAEKLDLPMAVFKFKPNRELETLHLDTLYLGQ